MHPRIAFETHREPRAFITITRDLSSNCYARSHKVAGDRSTVVRLERGGGADTAWSLCRAVAFAPPKTSEMRRRRADLAPLHRHGAVPSSSIAEKGYVAMPDRVARAKFDDLYALVSAMLADGRYRPGDRIGLKDLASRLHVSVTPLREVLSRLVGCDIVTERRSEGYYLARFDARDIADLYRLHCACIERALVEAPGMPLAVRQADIWETLRAIVEASGNTILSDVHRYLDGRLKLIRRAEIALLGGTESLAADLRQTLIDQDLDIARGKIHEIYKQRISMSAEIALLLGR